MLRRNETFEENIQYSTDQMIHQFNSRNSTSNTISMCVYPSYRIVSHLMDEGESLMHSLVLFDSMIFPHGYCVYKFKLYFSYAEVIVHKLNYKETYTNCVYYWINGYKGMSSAIKK